eukprot:231338_1
MTTAEFVEMQIKQSKQEEDTKEFESDSSSTQTLEATRKLLKNQYWMYYQHKISGPHTDFDLFQLYFTGGIKDKIWIKRVQANIDEAEWCEIDLNKINIDKNNKAFKTTLPELYQYLIPKIKLESIEYDKY